MQLEKDITTTHLLRWLVGNAPAVIVAQRNHVRQELFVDHRFMIHLTKECHYEEIYEISAFAADMEHELWRIIAVNGIAFDTYINSRDAYVVVKISEQGITWDYLPACAAQKAVSTWTGDLGEPFGVPWDNYLVHSAGNEDMLAPERTAFAFPINLESMAFSYQEQYGQVPDDVAALVVING
jgi:hypothetical protein